MYPSFEAGVAFAPKVRRAGYVTIFDLFQLKFGKNMGAVLFFNELFANIFWEAAILGALGRDENFITKPKNQYFWECSYFVLSRASIK